jgi:hypothetical protein
MSQVTGYLILDAGSNKDSYLYKSRISTKRRLCRLYKPLAGNGIISTTICQRSRFIAEFALCLDMKLVDEFDKALLDKNLIRPSVNRAYYAMFYAVLALLAQGKKETSKHLCDR